MRLIRSWWLVLFVTGITSSLAFAPMSKPTYGLSSKTISNDLMLNPHRQCDNAMDNRVVTQTRLNALAVGAAVETFYRTSPYLAAFLTCGIKASAADVIAQNQEIRKSKSAQMNIRRNVAFILYGGLYQGMFQEHMYNHIFPMIFGAGTDFLTVSSKVVFDIFFLNPLLCLPVAYLSKSIIFRYSPKEAIRRYISDIKERNLLQKCWSLWFPVQCLTFSIIPEYLRITFIAGVSFFWLILLSSISAKGEAAMVEDEQCLLIDGSTCRIDG